jgi:1,4-dihydroxy-2-naphthoate octaprenyltransferase
VTDWRPDSNDATAPPDSHDSTAPSDSHDSTATAADSRDATAAAELSRRSHVVCALWQMLRPEQVVLILFLYVVGAVIGVSTGSGGAATLRRDANALIGGGVALLAVAATVHYANEYADYETDARSPAGQFSGGSGGLHEYDLPRSLARVATVATAVAVGPAAVAAWTVGVPPRALALLAVILVGGWQYSLPPLALAWRGAGVPANALLGALLLPVYGAAVVTTPSVVDALFVAPFTVVTGLSLLTTEWPDRAADAAVGKHTLAARLDTATLGRLFRVLAASYVAVVAGVHLLVGFPPLVLAAHVAVLPLLVWAERTYTRRELTPAGVASMVTLAVASGLAWTWTLLESSG